MVTAASMARRAGCFNFGHGGRPNRGQMKDIRFADEAGPFSEALELLMVSFTVEPMTFRRCLVALFLIFFSKRDVRARDPMLVNCTLNVLVKPVGARAQIECDPRGHNTAAGPNLLFRAIVLNHETESDKVIGHLPAARVTQVIDDTRSSNEPLQPRRDS